MGTSAQHRDTGRRRWADAHRPFVAALSRFQGFPRLYFYTLALPLPAAVGLYSTEASRAARMVSASVFGAAPARWKLERGRGGALHLHAVSPLPPRAILDALDVRPVHDLRGLLVYLAKPADSRLCAASRSWVDPATHAREMRAAVDERAAARKHRLAGGRRHLPAVTGWTGTGTNPRHLHPGARVCLTLRLHALCIAFLSALHGAWECSPQRHPLRFSCGPSRPLPAPARPPRYTLPPPDRPPQAQAR